MTATDFRIERILLPTDFSDFSNQALRHALALARKFKARLKVVYVIPQVYVSGEAAFIGAAWLITPEIRQQAEEELRRFLSPAREARIDHEMEVREGEPWREIVAAAEEMRADLVVTGTHGRSGAERFILGSVAEKLVRRLPCPVLTVCHEEGRTWETPGLIGRILCATDFSEAASHALKFSLALAASTQAEVTLLHAVEIFPDLGEAVYRAALPEVQPLRAELQRKAAQQLDETLVSVRRDDHTVHVTPRVVVGRAYKEILWVAAEERADLIVIGAQGHGPIEHMISGSNAQHVIRRATCPVLTVRPLHLHSPVDEARSKLTLATPAGASV